MYHVTHTYLTADDDGNAVVETETVTVAEVYSVAETVAQMLANPGGRSGTTIALMVTVAEPVRL